jgi:hypothetical protein
MNRLMRVAQMAVVAAVFGAAAVGLWYSAGPVDVALADDKWHGPDSTITVIGDSTTYSIYHFILPGARDTSETFSTKKFDLIDVTTFGCGDSIAYWIDTNQGDPSTWTTIVDSSFVNSSELTDFPPTKGTWKLLFDEQLIHDQAIGTAHGPTYRNWFVRFLRVRLMNIDESDTLINVRTVVEGRER